MTCSDQNACPLNEECVFNGKANQCVCRRGYIRDVVGEQCRGNSLNFFLMKNAQLNLFFKILMNVLKLQSLVV